MHEMSLCQSMLEIIEKECQKQDVTQVTDLWLEIGVLSCVEQSALDFCFKAASRHTVANGCALHFIEMPAKAWCWQCGQLVEITSHTSTCPICESAQIQIQQGNELRIREIAVK